MKTGNKSVVGQAHLLSPECPAVAQQNCYPCFQNWGAGTLIVLFKFVQETCSHRLNGYGADTLTIYLLQCKQAAFSVCAV